jgi:K+-transporting ATPase KdpF subunit
MDARAAGSLRKTARSIVTTGLAQVFLLTRSSIRKSLFFTAHLRRRFYSAAVVIGKTGRRNGFHLCGCAAGARCLDLGGGGVVRAAGAASMSLDHALALVLAIAVAGYLFWALLRAEDF